MDGRETDIRLVLLVKSSFMTAVNTIMICRVHFPDLLTSNQKEDPLYPACYLCWHFLSTVSNKYDGLQRCLSHASRRLEGGG